MSPAAVLVLVVRILGVEGGEARLEAGLLDGLRTGDAGTVFYELSVGGETRQIEAGAATVVAAEEGVARAAVPAAARAGFLVRFELPAERVGAAAMAELAAAELARLDGAARDAALRRWAERLVPGGHGLDQGLALALAERLAGPAAGRAVESRKGAGRAAAPPAVQIPGGRYEIGRDLVEASFYNQHPRFEVDLEPFWIDEAPISGAQYAAFDPGAAAAAGPMTGVTWDEAEAYCRWRGAALPSEMQWEAAMSTARLESGGLEWTASWYRPYPGNTVPEPEYGETMRVIRGSVDPAERALHRRLFAPPTTRAEQVGFRCVVSGEQGQG